MKNLENKIELGEFHCLKDSDKVNEDNEILNKDYIKEKCYESGSPCMFLEYVPFGESKKQYVLFDNHNTYKEN